MDSKEDESEDLLPLEICEVVETTSLDLLPAKSRNQYNFIYKTFTDWKQKSKTLSSSEKVLLTYFNELSEKYKPSTLWSYYSMLKTTIKLYEKLDIGTYIKLSAFMKKQSHGFQSNKSKVFTAEEIRRFLIEASDRDHLLKKVVLIFGVTGACRKDELTNIKVQDVESHGSLLLIKITVTKSARPRSFVIGDDFRETVEKYRSLRPPKTNSDRFFLNYVHGKCTQKVVGKNTFGSIPKKIAEFLKLPDADLFTGHCFRRTSATVLADSNMTTLKCLSNWKSTAVTKRYIGEPVHKKSKIVQQLENRQESDCNLIKKESANCIMKSQINSQMMSECSRRPIQCPRLDCAVNVAFSALTNHFIFDHPEVPILSVDPGEKSTLVVNFDGLLYDSSRCLALLLVSGKLSGPAAKQFNGSHVHPRFKNRLPLPILAARLYCNASYEGVHAAGEGSREDGGDVVIAWVAGLDIGNTTTGALRCSIQAIDSIDNEAFRSLTYTGPINSLRTAQKPREVFLTGDCVILHDGFINHITSGCENLNVNVTIH